MIVYSQAGGEAEGYGTKEDTEKGKLIELYKKRNSLIISLVL